MAAPQNLTDTMVDWAENGLHTCLSSGLRVCFAVIGISAHIYASVLKIVKE